MLYLWFLRSLNGANQLIYDSAFLASDVQFARPHEVAGVRMHGGFDSQGHYVSPRSLGRAAALDAWEAALITRGGGLFDADASLLTGPRLPNLAQHRLLLRNGISRPFWNMLTITGKIEGRGRLLAEMQFPDLQALIVEDISTLALGHLNKGLLEIHGIDEGGEPDKGIGGHDVMWFVARDMVLGKQAHPDIEPPESIARPEAGKRWLPEIAPEYEGMLSFLMNLLMIEFRAEIGFSNTQDILRTPELFANRRETAEEAAMLVGRIRQDEEIHVRSLQLYLGELRELQLRTESGGTVAARDFVDEFWRGLVHWATVEQPAIAALAQRQTIEPIILAAPGGADVLAQFDALGDLAG